MDEEKKTGADFSRYAKQFPLRHAKLIILGLVGIVLMMIAPQFEEEQQPKTEHPAVPSQTTVSEERMLEEKLTSILRQVRGAGEVAVMVKFGEAEQAEYAKNSTREKRTITESEGGGEKATVEEKRTEELVMSRENGKEQPITARRIKPKITGILVAADGAADPAVREKIYQALIHATGVPVYRISVLAKRRGSK